MNEEFKSQLTALALDELTGDERATLEAAVARTPEAQAYADQTQVFCTLLTQSLGAPAEAGLTDDQRTALARRLLEPMESERRGWMTSGARTWVSWAAGLGAAAAALVATHVLGTKGGPKEIAASERARGVVELQSTVESGATESLAWRGREAKAEDATKSSELATLQRGTQPLSDQPSEPGAELAEFGSTREIRPVGALDGEARENLARTQRLESQVQLADGSTTRAKEIRWIDEPMKSQVQPATAPPPPAPGDAAAEPRSRSLLAQQSQSDYRFSLLADSKKAPAVSESLDSLADGLAVTESEGLLAGKPAGPVRFMETEIRLAGEPAAAGASLGLAVEGAPPAASAFPALNQLSAVDSAGGAAGGLVAENARLYKFGDQADRLSLEKKDLDRPETDDFIRYRRASTTSLSAEAYEDVPENAFLAVGSAPLSTFSIDVDTAGYANVRRFLNQGQRPPRAAVRLEELVNYFRYDYPAPAGDAPFSVTVDLTECPWQPQHRLARIGLQGKVVSRDQRPAANLVFLVDVSGSMDEPNKLPLVKQSLHLLTSQLKGGDHVAIVTYAGQSGVALPSTSLEQKETVSRAIDALTAGGSTNGASGLQLAYQQARQHFKQGGVNRVLLATDGDFNVGVTSRDELHSLITREAGTGVFLSVLGYGMGNLKDGTMELLADNGNGNYAYIDSLSEARKVLAEQLEGTLMAIAKDVKVQIEFNPGLVRQYRLLGYENRILAKEDFNDDRKDAGEIGAGHSVTALYEIVPITAPAPQPPVDPLKYQPVPTVAAAQAPANAPASPETMTVKLRYKPIGSETSQLLEVPVTDENKKFADGSTDFQFATSVAMTGLLLKDSAYKGTSNWNQVRALARAGKGADPEGYRGEFLQLVEKAAGVAP